MHGVTFWSSGAVTSARRKWKGSGRSSLACWAFVMLIAALMTSLSVLLVERGAEIYHELSKQMTEQHREQQRETSQ